MTRARPLRIVVIARAVMPLHGFGGLERSVHDLVRHLADRGVGITLIVPPVSVRHRSWSDPFAQPPIAVRHVSYLTFPFANRRGTTVIDRGTAYLLYGHRAGRLAHSLARAGEADIIHGFGASLLGAAMGPRVVPLVLNPQGLEEFGATAATQTLLKRVGYAPLRWAVRRAARAADCIIATDVALEPTVARHLKPRPGQMETIPNGIDLVALAATAGPAAGALLRQRSGIGGDERVLLSVGRLEFNKGFDVLARALGRASRSASFKRRPWRWVIVGAGPYRSHIERAVSEAGIAAQTMFAGRVSEPDLHAWYEAATVFVHPTRYEGSSLVTLEAMAHRRPVVATNAGGLPDKVRPGMNGWLVAPDDGEVLAAALEDALSDDERLRVMGASSRTIVEQNFSWSVIADRHIAMYERLLAESRPAAT
jgi:glycogen(starch) synthase